MTREERGLAIGFFKLRRRIFCDNHLKNCPKNSNEYIATLIEKSFYDMAIKALEKEDVLDKIRAEILEEKECAYADFERYKVEYLGQDCEDVLDSIPQDDFRYGMERCIDILDKYKVESEV